MHALQRLNASNMPDDTQELELKITASKEAMLTLVNLLGVMQFNSSVGHSTIVAAYVDGDGADRIAIEGLPEGDYQDMGNALCSYGDDIALVGPYTAQAFSTRHPEGVDESLKVYKSTTVFEDGKKVFAASIDGLLKKKLEEMRNFIASVESQKTNPTVASNYWRAVGIVEALAAVLSKSPNQINML